MIRRLWTRLCPHCLHDETPLAEHPAILSLERNASVLDRLLKMVNAPPEGDDGSPLPLPPLRRDDDR
jgi:hypothetical protein